MRRPIPIPSILGFSAGVLLAAAAARAGSPTSDWDRLRSLVGSWQGKSPEGPVSVTYTLVSNGTALMEQLDGNHDTHMVTMYTPDGAVLLATHYCSAGNQPRMRAKASPDGKSVDFQFVDVSNAKGSADEVMQRLVVTFVDADHFDQQWTSRGADGQEHTSLFQYTRRRP
jgi:hypothetical protein